MIGGNNQIKVTPGRAPASAQHSAKAGGWRTNGQRGLTNPSLASTGRQRRARCAHLEAAGETEPKALPFLLVVEPSGRKRQAREGPKPCAGMPDERQKAGNSNFLSTTPRSQKD